MKSRSRQAMVFGAGRYLLVALGALMVAYSSGCGPAARHRVLTIFFDGVPPSGGTVAPHAPSAPQRFAPSVSFYEHGPFAAKMCQSCHEPQTNNLVAPATELCYNCHELRLTKAYVHGPLASGGCTVCHDPHSSPNRFLLVADSSTFCIRCHDAQEVAQNPAHQGVEKQCTECHDAHMSDKRYLLK